MTVLVAVVPILIWCPLFNVHTARILGIFHTRGYSHCTLGETLMKGLAARGHYVTMVCPYPRTVPVANYTDIQLNGLREIVDSKLVC